MSLVNIWLNNYKSQSTKFQQLQSLFLVSNVLTWYLGSVIWFWVIKKLQFTTKYLFIY